MVNNVRLDYGMWSLAGCRMPLDPLESDRDSVSAENICSADELKSGHRNDRLVWINLAFHSTNVHNSCMITKCDISTKSKAPCPSRETLERWMKLVICLTSNNNGWYWCSLQVWTNRLYWQFSELPRPTQFPLEENRPSAHSLTVPH